MKRRMILVQEHGAHHVARRLRPLQPHSHCCRCKQRRRSPAPHHSPARSLDGENRGAEASGQPRPPRRQARKRGGAGDDAPREGSPAKAPGVRPGDGACLPPDHQPRAEEGLDLSPEG